MERQVSVVIPVLDMAAALPACLAALAGAPVAEVIVVDGGSGDGSADVARAGGASVLIAPAGRGGQMRAGAAAARCEWLLFLHADTVLTGNWQRAAAAADAGRAGYFRLRLASPRRAARLMDWVAARRSIWFAIPYGDQGLLIHRELLAAVGGVPDLVLMEDVVLARRLGRRRLCLLDGTAASSAARYERNGFLRRGLQNFCCLTLFFLGVPVTTIKKLYA